MNVLVWILFGALAGWIASMITGRNREMGAILNIVVGIFGALIGGYIARALGGSGVTGFNLSSLIVAILGSVLLIWVVSLFNGHHHSNV
jgi:uncharacterized membrane protein YeaQ/YmgE (transglycosylase-associated protein family)